MNNIHVNNVINTLAPSDNQKKRMFESIIYKNEKTHNWRLPRKPLIAAFSVVIIFALFVGIFPILQRNESKGLEFAFTGFTITAHAAEITDGSITFDIKLFEKFDKVDVSVTKGYIALNDNKNNSSTKVITVKGNETFYWEYGSFENAILSFAAFNKNGDVVSEGSLDMSTGEMVVKNIKCYPEQSK